MNSEYWKKKVFNHWDQLNRLANKRFPDPNTAHEAMLYVLEKLEEKNWKRVRSYQGRSQFSTFIVCITLHLFEDFSRHKFGYFRPPAWVKARGALWIDIFKMLCLERMSLPEVIDALTCHGVQTKKTAMIEEIVSVILAKIPSCGKKRGEIVPMEPEALDVAASSQAGSQRLSPEDTIMTLERISLLEAISRQLVVMEDNQANDPPGESKLATIISQFHSEVHLEVEDRLLLKAIYQDGLSVSAAGRLLGWGTNQTHGRLHRLLKRLRKTFKKLGLEEAV